MCEFCENLCSDRETVLEGGDVIWPYFIQLASDLEEILYSCEFHENRHRKSPKLLKGVNETLPYFLHYLSHLEKKYSVQEKSAITSCVRVSRKSAQ